MSREQLIAELQSLQEKCRGLRDSESKLLALVESAPAITQEIDRDITERKNAFEELRLSEERFRLVADFTYDWEVWIDPTGLPLYVSPSCERITGYPPEAFQKNPDLFEEIVHSDDRLSFGDHLHAVTQSAVFESEFRIIDRRGLVRWIAHLCQPVYGRGGEFLGRRASNRDITRQKLAELKLMEQHAFLQAVLASTVNGLAVCHDLEHFPEVQFTLWNSRMQEITGLALEEANRTTGFATLFSPTSPSLVATMVREALAGHPIIDREVEIVQPSGKVRIVAISVKALDFASRINLLFIMHDVTERRSIEETVHRLAIAVENLSEEVIITDRSANILYVNPAFERITGYTRNEVLGKNPRLLKSGKHDRLFYEHLWSDLRAGKVWYGTFINRAKSGALIEEQATITAFYDHLGKHQGYASVKRDITETARLEAQLNQAQKMEAVGQLAGGIAHDFNNLLQAISGFTRLVMDDLPPNHPAHENLGEVVQASDRARGLARQLLIFSRQLPHQTKRLDLNDVIRGFARMLKRVLGDHIEQEHHLYDGKLHFLHDQGQIEQILMNLCVNARDAMPTGGLLTISTGHETVSQAQCSAFSWVKPGNFIFMKISDQGAGMTSEIMQRIFEPFFSTKETGKGTGLGLATVYGIAKRERGFVLVESTPGCGSTFTVYFPLFEEILEAAGATNKQVEAAALPSGRGETILFVDDDELVRMFVSTALKRNGYRVICAENGDEAQEIFSRDSDGFQVVITDLLMPKMGGHILVQNLRSISETVPILYISGYATTTLMESGIEIGDNDFLQKPFRIDELLQKLDDLLAPIRSDT